MVHQKNTKIVGLETELRHITRGSEVLDAEKAGLKKEIESLNSHMKILQDENNNLQQQLTEYKSSVSWVSCIYFCTGWWPLCHWLVLKYYSI